MPNGTDLSQMTIEEWLRQAQALGLQMTPTPPAAPKSRIAMALENALLAGGMAGQTGSRDYGISGAMQGISGMLQLRRQQERERQAYPGQAMSTGLQALEKLLNLRKLAQPTEQFASSPLGIYNQATGEITGRAPESELGPLEPIPGPGGTTVYGTRRQALGQPIPQPAVGPLEPIPGPGGTTVYGTRRQALGQPVPQPGMTPYQQAMLRISEQRLLLAKKNASSMGLPPAAISKADSLARSFDSHPVIKQFNETAARYEGLKLLVEGEWTGPSDLAIVFEFMRALDPTSVVRESEYATAASSGNIFKGWAARFNGMVRPGGGFLSEQVRNDFMRALDQKVGVVKGQTKNIYTDFGRRIERITGQPGTGTDWLTDYTEMLPEAGAETTGAPPRPKGVPDSAIWEESTQNWVER